MVYGYRYIQTDKNGRVSGSCADPVFVEGVEITIDTEGMTVPEMPTDGIYELYYSEEEGLHWVKTGELQAEVLTEADKQEAALAYIMAMTEGA